MDVNFEKMLAEYNQSYIESEAFTRWMPPDGDYIVVVQPLTKGVSPQDDGSNLMWWRLTGKIVEEGTYKDRVFMIGYFTNKAFGILKAATEALAGTPAPNIVEADKCLEASEGVVLRVSVEETWSKKNKQNYKNATIESVLTSDAVDPA